MHQRDIEAAVGRLLARDPLLGRDAREVSTRLAEQSSGLSQAALQRWLWLGLPSSVAAPRWERLQEVAATLLDELGHQRYATIARSEETTRLLQLWRVNQRRAAREARAALAASGVLAPDTATFRWSSPGGLHEGLARDQVERALEEAVLSGRLQPGSRGWRAEAERICEAVLDGSVPHLPGQTVRTIVVTERVERWVTAPRDRQLRARRERFAKHVLVAQPPPPAMGPMLEPMQWLLGACEGGLQLTASLYLPVSAVHESVERFGWWSWDKPPRSEADVHQLDELRTVATRGGLIRRSARTLTTTAAGMQCLGDPQRLWEVLTAGLGGFDEFGDFVAQELSLRLLIEPVAPPQGELKAEVVPAIAAQGWRTEGRPTTDADIVDQVHRLLDWWHVLGLVGDQRQLGPGGGMRSPQVRLSPLGRAAALAHLHHQATGPPRR